MSASTGKLVYIVDDCDKVREGLSRLLASAGYRVISFDSAEAFLAAEIIDNTCVILDVKMPGASGPELQQQLVRMGHRLHIIFLSGHADVPTTVGAMKLGAVDFLEKPVSSQTLLDTVDAVMQRISDKQTEVDRINEYRRRFENLTRREKQIMIKVVSGHPNKHIAAALGLHEQTIKQHRGSVMRKMDAESLAELVRMSSSIGITPEP